MDIPAPINYYQCPSGLLYLTWLKVRNARKKKVLCSKKQVKNKCADKDTPVLVEQLELIIDD
jgi:hypothetical protein